MVVATFDTLKFANALKAAGVPDKQAEAEAAVLADAFSVNLKELVTKDDLRQALGETEQRLNAKIDLVRSDLGGQITLVRWMLGVVISIGVAILVRLFFFR
jgi:hypothetical protein